jgi:hypothetical protein
MNAATKTALVIVALEPTVTGQPQGAGHEVSNHEHDEGQSCFFVERAVYVAMVSLGDPGARSWRHLCL